MRSFARERPLVLLWFGYLLWYFTLNAMSNLSLYTREAVGRDPKDLSGIIMALRFGFKAVGGFVLGGIAIRWGVRAPLAVCVVLVGGSLVWAWIAPGYGYLLAFGFMGAGELGGAYFPNYQVTLSTPAMGTRDLAMQSLTSPVSSHCARPARRLDRRLRFSGELRLRNSDGSDVTSCSCFVFPPGCANLEKDRAVDAGLVTENGIELAAAVLEDLHQPVITAARHHLGAELPVTGQVFDRSGCDPPGLSRARARRRARFPPPRPSSSGLGPFATDSRSPRSAGPMKTISIPGTAAISRTLATASGVSIWATMKVSRFASAQ